MRLINITNKSDNESIRVSDNKDVVIIKMSCERDLFFFLLTKFSHKMKKTTENDIIYIRMMKHILFR